MFFLPSIIGVLIFFIIPLMVIVFYSFLNNPIDKQFVFLNNYKDILNNSAFILACKNTMIFSGIAVPLAVFLSLGLALILECNIPYKSQFRTFFLSPIMVPIASVVLIWQIMFSSSGTINQFIELFGTSQIDWLKSQYAQIVIIVLFLWKNLGYNMILFMAALNNIPKDLLEVAEIENPSFLFKLIQIKLRFISPTLLFVTLLSLINSFKVFREVHLLAGDYPYESLYMLQHYMNNTFKSLDYQKLATAAVIMAMVIFTIIGILFAFEKHYGKDIEG